ncbi:MAG: periplasmic heavy metal sensor [Verrucomicrobia bacterium]|nr:periplasmic heavy metal sensor [Kiritimatiellia bacterium]MCO6401527.1 periplasmic heavy metal sensor [Verrucomicrobiota bacterium]
MSASRFWILAIVAAAAIAFAVGRFSASPDSASDVLRDLSVANLDWLGLTSAQADEVRQLQPAYEESLRAMNDQQVQARCQLVHALTADEWDGETARAAVDAMCEAHVANEQATLHYLERVRSILTPEQRARLMARVGKCLCEECAEGQGSCCIITTHKEKEDGT